MSVDEQILSEANRLLDRTEKALPNYHLAGIDQDATDALLRRDGLKPLRKSRKEIGNSGDYLEIEEMKPDECQLYADINGCITGTIVDDCDLEKGQRIIISRLLPKFEAAVATLKELEASR